MFRQNDSLDALLLDETFLQFKKGRNDPTQTLGLWVLIWLMDILIVMH